MRSIMRFRLAGFSVVELLVVAIIVGAIALGASPRFSRAANSLGPATLRGDLAVLRNGLDLYASDHGGRYPTLVAFQAQMTRFTDIQGNVSPARDSAHRFGPYLRTVPLLPVGPNGFHGTNSVVDAAQTAPGATAGAWLYNSRTGEIHANLPRQFTDAAGRPFCRY